MHGNDFLWELILLSHPFRWIVGRKITAGSSGCLIRRDNRLIALTVQYGDPPGAPVLYGFHHRFRGPVLYPLLDPFSVEIPGILGPDKKKTYLICSELADPGAQESGAVDSVETHYQEVGPNGEIIHEKARKEGNLDASRVPNLADRYGFSCFKDILVHLDDYDHLVFSEQNMEFTGKTRGLFRFRCARRDSFFLPSGCQGSPIVDERGNVVSLIVGGDSSKQIYYGLDLWKFLDKNRFPPT
ncbi:MAG: hypothetical protein KDK25_02730 [Leptospiraceae bacterium]|nr:hypothetical protein [Leptospiraceae bacterium]